MSREFLNVWNQIKDNFTATKSVNPLLSAFLQAEILNLSEGGTQIWLDQPLRYASLVRIEYNDNLLLGEVVYCKQEQDGWLVGIRVEHSLVGVKAFARATGAH